MKNVDIIYIYIYIEKTIKSRKFKISINSSQYYYNNFCIFNKIRLLGILPVFKMLKQNNLLIYKFDIDNK